MRRHQHDDEAFDERGVLRDGQRLRVPLTLMDGIDPMQRAVAREGLRVTDGQGGVTGLHRPGFRIADARKRATHYDPRGRLRGYSETETETEEDEEERRQTSDAAMRARDAAYRDYEDQLTNAYKDNRPAEQTADRQVGRDRQQQVSCYDAYDAELREAWRRG